jgi:hypothetical protein
MATTVERPCSSPLTGGMSLLTAVITSGDPTMLHQHLLPCCFSNLSNRGRPEVAVVCRVMFSDRETPVRGEVVEAAGIVIVSMVTVAGATQTNSTGPVLAFAGAVLVAVVAAATAGRRQRRDLDAANARHTAELAAQAERMHTQLHHDRRLKDIDDLRAFLDDGASAYEEAADQLQELAVALRRDDERERATAALTATRGASEQVRRADVFARRVALRFTHDEAIAIHYGNIAAKLTERYRALLEIIPQRITDAQDDTDSTLGAEAMVSWIRFATEARNFVGAQPRPAYEATDS